MKKVAHPYEIQNTFVLRRYEGNFYRSFRLIPLSEGKATPCWRAPPDRGWEFQDVLSMKNLLDVSYRSRWRHNMIPLSVKIRKHAVSPCAQAGRCPTLSNHLVFRHLGIMTSLNVGLDGLPVLAKCSQGKCPYSCKKPLKISEVENPKIRKSDNNHIEKQPYLRRIYK